MKLVEAYPAATVCRLLDLPRSSSYFRGRPDEDEPLRRALLDLAGRCEQARRREGAGGQDGC